MLIISSRNFLSFFWSIAVWKSKMAAATTLISYLRYNFRMLFHIAAFTRRKNRVVRRGNSVVVSILIFSNSANFIFVELKRASGKADNIYFCTNGIVNSRVIPCLSGHVVT